LASTASEDSPPTVRGSLALLATRRFGTFWVASLLSNIGTWAQQVAEPLLILSLSGSAFLVGLDGFAMNAPIWVLTLVGGVFADRLDRRAVILGFQTVQALCPATLIVLLLTHSVRPWHVIALSIVVGITDALSMPSFQSIVPGIVEPPKIGTAYALNSVQFNLSRILGPAIAAVLMAHFGALACFGVNTLSYAPFILVALWILPRKALRSALLPSTAASPFAGLREIVGRRDLRNGLLITLLTSVLCAPLVNLCAVVIQEVFHGGARELGSALSAFGAGGLVGALSLVALAGKIEPRNLGSTFAIVYAAIVVGVALTSSFTWVLMLLVVGGAAMTMSNTSVNTLLQTTVGDSLRGETASLYMLSMRGGLALGSLVTGAVANTLGVRTALLANGVLAVVGQVWLAYRSPAVAGRSKTVVPQKTPPS
jgi:predicted MFS family arabinose efflux permease